MNNPAQIVFNIPELKRLIYDFDPTYKKDEYKKVIQELNQKFYKSILIANFRGDYLNYNAQNVSKFSDFVDGRTIVVVKYKD